MKKTDKTNTLDYADLLKKAGATLGTDEQIVAAAPAFRAVDHVNAVLKAAAGVPGIDINALLAMLLPTLLALLQGVIHKPAPAPTPTPGPTPTPTPTPSPTPTPGPSPSPTPSPSARVIRSFSSRRHQIVRNGGSWPKRHKGPEGEENGYDAILARESPVLVKDKLVGDSSPLDQNGIEIRDGEWTPELTAAMYFRNDTQRVRWYGHNRDISHITMTHPLGLMPVQKIDNLPNDQDVETGDVYALYYIPNADGSDPAPEDDEPDTSRPHIVIPALRSLRARR